MHLSIKDFYSAADGSRPLKLCEVETVRSEPLPMGWHQQTIMIEE